MIRNFLMKFGDFLIRKEFLLLVILSFIFVSFFHLYKLTDIPKGLYHDESAIGYNAALISKDGYDEHGESLPLFFKSFNDYKNPIYIYTAALIFKLFGISEFNLKLTSFLFHLMFVVCLYFFSYEVFKKNKFIAIFSIFAGGFLPYFFAISRVAFEVVSQGAFVMLSLVLLRKLYYNKKFQSLNKKTIDLSILAGLSIGLTVYTYTTSRLLTFLFLTSFFITHLKRKYILKHLLVVFSLLISLIPYGIYALNKKGLLTERFQAMSYVFDHDLTLLTKLKLFEENYMSYFKPTFLLIFGDTNIRHSTECSGMLYLTIFSLAVFALFYMIYARKIFKDKFLLFLLLNFIFSPVAAALINAKFHGLRSNLIGLYFLIFALYGLYFVYKKIRNAKYRMVFVFVVFITLSIESFIYLKNYFTVYPNKSAYAFEYYDAEKILKSCAEQRPDVIYIYDPHLIYSHLEFLRTYYPIDIPVVFDLPTEIKDSCILYFNDKESYIQENYPQFIKFNSKGSLIQLRVDKCMGFKFNSKELKTNNFSIDAVGDSKCEIVYMSKGREVFKQEIFIEEATEQKYEKYIGKIHKEAMEKGFDEIKILPVSDNFEMDDYTFLESSVKVKGDRFNKPVKEGLKWDSGFIFLEKDLVVEYDEINYSKNIEVSADFNDKYLIFFYKDEDEIGRIIINENMSIKGMNNRNVNIPDLVSNKGFDKLYITPLSGDGRYSVGHVRLID